MNQEEENSVESNKHSAQISAPSLLDNRSQANLQSELDQPFRAIKSLLVVDVAFFLCCTILVILGMITRFYYTYFLGFIILLTPNSVIAALALINGIFLKNMGLVRWAFRCRATASIVFFLGTILLIGIQVELNNSNYLIGGGGKDHINFGYDVKKALEEFLLGWLIISIIYSTGNISFSASLEDVTKISKEYEVSKHRLRNENKSKQH